MMSSLSMMFLLPKKLSAGCPDSPEPCQRFTMTYESSLYLGVPKRSGAASISSWKSETPSFSSV